MRYMFIALSSPDKLDNGKNVVLNGLFTYLININGTDNFSSIVFSPSEIKKAWREKQIKADCFLMVIARILWYSFIKRKMSIQEAFFFSSRYAKSISKEIAYLNPDVIIFDTVRLARITLHEDYIKNKAKNIVYLDDLFSLRYHRMLSNKNQFTGSYLGAFSKKLPSLIASTLDMTIFFQKLMIRHEEKTLSVSEVEIANKMDVSLLINYEEVNLLLSRLESKSLKSVCEVKTINPYRLKGEKTIRNWKGERRIIFLGALNIPHNISGIQFFLKRDFPEILKSFPDIKLLIIGRDAPIELYYYQRLHPENIEILGFVDNISSILSSASAMIVPLEFGSGVKLKVIDGIAAGVPIISTKIGIEGINFSHKKNGFIVENTDDYIAALKYLFDVSINHAISRNNSELYEKNYSALAVATQYDEIFKP